MPKFPHCARETKSSSLMVRKVHPHTLCPVEGTDQYLVYTRWGAEGERPKPAASGSTLWSFEVVQSAGPKG